MADNQDDLVAQFVDVTGATPLEATQLLTANHWDIAAATTEYYTSQDEDMNDDDGSATAQPVPETPYTGPRTLDGRPAPESALPTSSSSRAAPPKRGVGGIATLGSIGQSSSHAGHGHAHDDDDSDDSDEGEQPRDLFAGGEKSALVVQDPSKSDPRKVVNDILKKARQNAKRPGGDDAAGPASRFRGTGQTLGDESTPSQAIPDPAAAQAATSPPVTRILHIWEDGFSIADGELRRFDDPRHARDLQMIQNGRAPVHLMDVRPDQAVDVQLIKHNEKYQAPPKVYKPFSGGGNRLGSPTPGGSSTTETPESVVPTPSATTAAPEPFIDASQPTLSLRIQLGDGTRLPAQFNTTSTIGDVYDFVARASSDRREWVLATTFPSKNHTDKSLQLGDVPEFKRGGAAVQKWL